MASRLLQMIRAITGRDHREREMQEEMAAHLDEAVARLRARGMSEEDARRAALREFGNLPYLQEQARDAWPLRWLDELRADVSFALRTFRRTPIATATIVLILALGLGVNTALFNLIHSVLSVPPPGIERDNSLVRIQRLQRVAMGSPYGVGTAGMSYHEIQEYASRTDLFRDVAGWGGGSQHIVRLNADSPELLSGYVEYVTDNYFEVLGVDLPLGAGFSPGGEEGMQSPDLPAVIDYGSWDRYFGRDPGILGQRIGVSGVSFTIAGVAPPNFRGLISVNLGRDPAQLTVWIPRSAYLVLSPELDIRLGEPIWAAARLQPGVEPSEARTELLGMAQRIANSGGDPLSGFVDVSVVPVTARDQWAPYSRGYGDRNFIHTALTEPAGAYGVTLLILAVVCMNAGALLAAYSLTRRREIVVRLALGASRLRIIRQLLTESVLRVLIAAALGGVILLALVPFLRNQLPGGTFAIDWEGVSFTFKIALTTGVILGIFPALHATRVTIAENLKTSSATVVGRKSHLARVFVVAQVAFTLPLIVYFSAIILDGLGHARVSRPGAIDEVVGISLDLSTPQVQQDSARSSLETYRERIARRDALMLTLEQRLSAALGIVGTVRRANIFNEGFVFSTRVTVHPEDRAPGSTAQMERVFKIVAVETDPDYFRVMNLPIVLGRDFSQEERVTRINPVPIVMNLEQTRRLWGELNPIGRRLLATGPEPRQEYIVVGAVDSGQIVATGTFGPNPVDSLDVPVFTTTAQDPGLRLTDEGLVEGRRGRQAILIRTQGDAEAMIPTIHQIVRETTPDLGITETVTIASIWRQETVRLLRMVGSLAGMGGLGLLLSAIGMYGVLSIAVGQRVPEIGTRIAMGSSPWRVQRIFLFEGMILGSVGIAIGIYFGRGFFYVIDILSLGAFRLPPDSHFRATFIASFLVMVTIIIASWLPARRASSVDPMTVLRAE